MIQFLACYTWVPQFFFLNNDEDQLFFFLRLQWYSRVTINVLAAWNFVYPFFSALYMISEEGVIKSEF